MPRHYHLYPLGLVAKIMECWSSANPDHSIGPHWLPGGLLSYSVYLNKDLDRGTHSAGCQLEYLTMLSQSWEADRLPALSRNARHILNDPRYSIYQYRCKNCQCCTQEKPGPAKKIGVYILDSVKWCPGHPRMAGMTGWEKCGFCGVNLESPWSICLPEPRLLHCGDILRLPGPHPCF